MTDHSEKITCAEFQSQLPELIGAGENMSNHPHIESCELCRALLADLETIAEAARQLFPAVEPSEDLWKQIESRIQDEGGSGGSADPSPNSRMQ
jgi:hypothetical protein